MNKLKIPENHSGISKTLRLPENIVDEVQNLAILKNLSFNKTIISLLEFSLENIDEKDKSELKKCLKIVLHFKHKKAHINFNINMCFFYYFILLLLKDL